MGACLEDIAKDYGVDVRELHLLNIQRLGLSTCFGSDVFKLRASFEVDGNHFHKPIINNSFSPYLVVGKNIFYDGRLVPVSLSNIEGDSPEPYYFRGSTVLVINTTIFGSCDQGCIFCEINSTPESMRRYSLVMPETDLFDRVMSDTGVSSLDFLSQISIITSCAGSESRSLELLRRYHEEASSKGFRGRFLFATNEVRAVDGVKTLADYGNVILAFTVECFTNRRIVMPGRKGAISLNRIKEILGNAKKSGMDSTYFYIFGIDDLESMSQGFTLFRDVISIAPTGPNYQPQGMTAPVLDVKPLEYFLDARKIYERVHKGMMMFESCQNYRSLWPLDASTTPHLV